MSEGKDPLDGLEERAWAAFALHAGQRLTTFNFFIILSSLLIGAMVTTFQKDFRVPYLGAVIGVLLALLAFIFWRIDVRNKQLIKLSEKAIRYFEERAPKPEGMSYHPAAFFTREARETDERKTPSGWRHFSYAKAFLAVYILVACAGIAGAIVAVVAEGSATTTASLPAREHQEPVSGRLANRPPVTTPPCISPAGAQTATPEITVTGTSRSSGRDSTATTVTAPLKPPPSSRW